MIWVVLSVLSVLTVWYYFIKPLSYWKNKGVRQSNPWPIVGDSWRFMRGNTAFLDFSQWIYKQGKDRRYFGFYQFFKRVLAVYDPELIKQITVKEFDSFMDHSFFFVESEADPTWANNVLILRGQEWKHMRSTLSPNYTGSKMRANYDLMVEAADNFVNYFLSKNEDYIEIEMRDAFSRYTNDVIASTAFGLKVDSLKNPSNEFYLHGKKITDFQSFGPIFKIILLDVAPVIWKLFGLKFMAPEPVKYFKKVFFETIGEREEKNINRPDLISILMEAKKAGGNNKKGKVMSDDELLAQSLIFFFAGFETIAKTLAFGAYELATNKEIQDRLREEVIETNKKHGNSSYDAMHEMKYMDMVVSEIIRKWPNFMTTDRCVSKPFTIQPINENEVPVKLEPGDVIYLPIYCLQRDLKYFPNPDKFDPERFSDENKHNINPYAYIPFGAGPRTCIGNRFAVFEIKCLLFNILLNFEIVPTRKTSIPPKLKAPSFQYTIDGGYWLGLKRIRT